MPIADSFMLSQPCSASTSLDRVVNIEDLRTLARRRAPGVDVRLHRRRSDGEVTLRDNRRSWDEVLFRPRNAVRVRGCDMRTELFGQTLVMPMLLAPVGYTRLFHPDGELGVAAAARDAGIGYVLSTFSGYACRRCRRGCRTALVSALSRRRPHGRRGIARAGLERGLPGSGHHDRHQRPGASRTRHAQRQLAAVGRQRDCEAAVRAAALRHPRWLAGFLSDRKEVMLYPNVVIPGNGPAAWPATCAATWRQPRSAWEDMSWIRERLAGRRSS